MFSGFGLGALAIFVATIVISLIGLKSRAFVDRMLFRPYTLVRNNEWHRLITSGFVHLDGSHLLFNMLSYFFFAFTLERAIGTTRFLVLYVVSLALSELGTWIKHRNDPQYASLGASGAVLAVMFAYIVYFPTSKLSLLILPIPVPAPIFAVLYLIYSWWQARQNGGRVNHDAHLGGAIVGLLFVLVTDPEAFARFFQVLPYLFS
ncbi:MAG: rhomboid family intramembrane serine protease [Gammaproteobacteria bacterium]